MMNVPVALAEVLDKEPGLMWIWLIYGSIAFMGLLLCRRNARWLALSFPLSLIVAVPGLVELHDIGPGIYSESPPYYFQWLLGTILAVLVPISGAVYYLRLNPKERLKIAIWTGAAVFILLALLVVRAAFSGTTGVYLIAPAVKLTANGEPIRGWVDREIHGYSVIITRNDKQKPESYLFVMLGEKGNRVSDCGDWAASRFPMMMLGHYNLPCLFFASSQEPEPKLPERHLVVASHFIEFTADDGKRLRVSW